jgi:type VI secretion system protein ImpG
MDRRLLRYYNRELQHLRELGGEFAREFPKVAGRLALDEFACADPYVERLLEGFAFLTARVQLKLDSEFPRFTQNVLETVYPHLLCPTPSMAVVQFQPDPSEGSLAGGFAVPRGTQLRSLLGKDEQTACLYRTAHDVTLWPLEITEARYHARDLGSLSPPNGLPAGIKAAVRFRVRCTGAVSLDKIAIEDLIVHLRGTGDVPPRLYAQLLGRTRAVAVRGTGGNAATAKWHHVSGTSLVSRVGFDDSEALLPATSRSFQGYRLLREYFVFPQRFLFVQFTGIGPALRATRDREADVLVFLSEESRELENALDPANFALHCTPAINLFPKRADRIHVTDRAWEFHVIPDRTRTLDYEVFQVLSVAGYGASADLQTEFRPFYAANEGDVDSGRTGAYFAVNRLPRAASAKEQRGGRRSTYPGTETYISLVDASSAPYRSDLKQLAAETLCTNRDLPLQMPVGRGRTDFTLETSAPVQAVRCVAGPTPPKHSSIEGETAWRLVGHLSLNYLSLADSDQVQGAAALRDLLRLYGDSSDPQFQKQIDGVRSIASRPISRQVSGPGPIAFARGLQVTVALDDESFAGTGIFLLGAVLDQFFAKYVSINSFTETVVHSAERGEVMRWPARTGRRHIL